MSRVPAARPEGGAAPARPPSDAESGARLAAQERDDHDRRRLFYRTALWCLGWSALGLFLVGWSMHTTDVGPAWIAFWGGLGLGNGGGLFTVVRAWRVAEHRGWL